MNKFNEDFLKNAEDVLSKLPCEYAELRFSMKNTSVISLNMDEIETINSGFSNAGSVRIFDKGRWSFVTFNNLKEFEKFAVAGMENIKLIPIDDKKGLKKYKPVNIEKVTKKEIDFATLSIEEKFEMLSSYNDILKDHSKIQTTRALYRDKDETSVFLNTEGSRIIYDKAHCGIGLTAFAKDGDDIQPHHDSVAGYGGFELVKGYEQTASNVVKTAVDLLSAEPVVGGQYRVILDPRMSGVFIHESFGHLSEADFVYKNERMKKIMELGRDFGPEILNVIDDGNIEDQPGYIPADDEGILPEKTYLIKDGKLNARLHSRETAFLMDEDVTGNGRAISANAEPIVRMTNTYIENGPNKKDDLFNNTEDGIYAVNFHGGQTNLEMFTFSSAYGYEVKNGKLGKMLKNVVLTGNVFETLKNIKMIADDKVLFGGLGGCGKGGQSPLPVSLGGPHVMIDNVLIGGNQ